MKRLESRKSHSWWWDSHISPKNSKWLAENLEEMDRSVKRMLKLIEEEGDSFAKKAEMYYQKRPELISHVEEFYRMYRSLAERYDHLMGELRKNIPSDLQSQGSSITDCGSETASPLAVLDRKPSHRRSRHRAAGFEFFLGSGGGSSDLSRKESDESSSSSLDSESESDAASCKNNYSGPPENDDGAGLGKRIIELEVELREVKEKLRMAEEENANALSRVTENGKYEELQVRLSWYEEELKVANERLQLSEEEVVKLKLEFANIESAEDAHYLRAQLESAQKEIEMKESELKLEKKELRITNGKFEASLEEIVRLKLELGKNECSEAACGLQVQLVSDPKDIEKNVARIESNNGLITGLESDIVDQDGRIEVLEEELRIRNNMLQLSEEEIVRLKLELKKIEASVVNAVDLQSQLEFAQEAIMVQEAECDLEKRQVSELQEKIMRLEINLSDRDHEIGELKLAITDVHKNFSLEKFQLQTEISGLSESQVLLEAKLKEWESRVRSLEEEIKRVEVENTELQELQVTHEMGMQNEIELLKSDIAEKCYRVEELNKSLDALKLKYDVLVAERDGLNAEVLRHISVLSLRDDRICQMDGHLQRLHMEHMELISGSEGARKLVEELGSRVKRLEEEVERQRAVISEGAEEKREAIRQLCFSLEHYRDGYHQLRQAFLVHKRPAVLAL